MKDRFHYGPQGWERISVAELFGIIEHDRQPPWEGAPFPTYSPEVKAEFAKLAERWRAVGLDGGPRPACGKR